MDKRENKSHSNKKIIAWILASLLLVSSLIAAFAIVNSFGNRPLQAPQIITNRAIADMHPPQGNRMRADQHLQGVGNAFLENGKLKWTNIPHAVDYRIYLGQGDSRRYIGSSHTNEATIDGLEHGAHYAFSVQAVARNEVNTSPLSTEEDMIFMLPPGTRRLNRPSAFLTADSSALQWYAVNMTNLNGINSGGRYRVMSSQGLIGEINHTDNGDKHGIMLPSNLQEGTTLRVMAISDDELLTSSQWSQDVVFSKNNSGGGDNGDGGNGGDGNNGGGGGDQELQPPTGGGGNQLATPNIALSSDNTQLTWIDVTDATNYIVEWSNDGNTWADATWVATDYGSNIVKFKLSNASWLSFNQTGASLQLAVRATSWRDFDDSTRSNAVSVDMKNIGGGNGGGGDNGNGGDQTPNPPDTGGIGGGDEGQSVGGFGHPTIAIPSDFWSRHGVQPFQNPDIAQSRLRQLLTQGDFDALFPNRMGVGAWFTNNPNVKNEDYYSYNNLVEAVGILSNIAVIIEMRAESRPTGITPIPWTQQVTVVHSSSPSRGVVVRVGEDFDADWNLSKPIVTNIINMGDFLNYENTAQKSSLYGYRELAAFLANLTQETSGGTTGEESRLTHGLWWNEEIGFEGNTSGAYVLDGHYFAPMQNPDGGHRNSYHGRGPIQLSWNYNYGLFSGIFFQDANILLERPELIVNGGNIRLTPNATPTQLNGGTLGWMTAIGFWMIPQPPKPSCHQVMMGQWREDNLDVSAGRHTAVDIGVNRPEVTSNGVALNGRSINGDYHSIGFAMSIIIINGGFEANKHVYQNLNPNSQPTQLHTRVHMYLRIAGRLQQTSGTQVQAYVLDEKLNTLGMGAY